MILPIVLTIHYAPQHGQHRSGPDHPESPSRLDSICVPALRALDLTWRSVSKPRSDAEEAVLRVHAREHVERVRGATGLTKLGPDTYARRGSFNALLAAQSLWLDAVDEVVETRQMSWALSRPPGHHAGWASADGFCIFNFCAAAAAYALPRAGNVGILDMDAHHGNGIASYVDSESRVTYASVHQSPLWPGTGDDADDRGPLANRLAAPVRRGARRDEYLRAWMSCIDFVKRQEPGLVIVSAGFDGLRDDPLVQCSLEPSDFALLAAAVKDAFPTTPIVFGLEGGYSEAMGPALVAAMQPWRTENVQVVARQTEDVAVLCAASELPEKGRMKLLAPGVCVGVDADGAPHAFSARLPPLGADAVAYGDFDPQVRCIQDRVTGSKFYVETGDVRGDWCPFFFGSKRGQSTAPWRRLASALLPRTKRRLPVARTMMQGDDVCVVRSDLEVLRSTADAPEPSPLLLSGVPTRRQIDAAAKTGRLKVYTTYNNGDVRSACVAADDPNLELGYYLVRTPRDDDPPTTATDDVIARLLHDGDSASLRKPPGRPCARVAAGVAVFVEPAARGRNLGEILFKQAMLACRRLGFDYMLFIERDSGSGRSVLFPDNRAISAGSSAGTRQWVSSKSRRTLCQASSASFL